MQVYRDDDFCNRGIAEKQTDDNVYKYFLYIFCSTIY